MKLSIMGMYEYDPNIFDDLTVPTGIDRDVVIGEICIQCSELEILYPDFDILKMCIRNWSKANEYTWQKLYDSTQFNYNPIWNVDASITEESEDDHTRSFTNTGSNTRSITRTGSGSNNETINLTNTEDVQGFNSSAWQDATKNTQSGTDNISMTSNDTVNDGNTTNDSGSERNNGTVTNTISRTGNIGVTTTQQMIEQEREIAKFSIINYIAVSFKERFCLLVY